jgi:hypothetical protein
MKTLSTLFISIFSFATVNATEISSNLEINNTAVIPATSLTTGAIENILTGQPKTKRIITVMKLSVLSTAITLLQSQQCKFLLLSITAITTA